MTCKETQKRLEIVGKITNVVQPQNIVGKNANDTRDSGSARQPPGVDSAQNRRSAPGQALSLHDGRTAAASCWARPAFPAGSLDRSRHVLPLDQEGGRCGRTQGRHQENSPRSCQRSGAETTRKWLAPAGPHRPRARPAVLSRSAHSLPGMRYTAGTINKKPGRTAHALRPGQRTCIPHEHYFLPSFPLEETFCTFFVGSAWLLFVDVGAGFFDMNHLLSWLGCFLLFPLQSPLLGSLGQHIENLLEL